jgi:hypothetical protein
MRSSNLIDILADNLGKRTVSLCQWGIDAIIEPVQLQRVRKYAVRGSANWDRVLVWNGPRGFDCDCCSLCLDAPPGILCTISPVRVP